MKWLQVDKNWLDLDKDAVMIKLKEMASRGKKSPLKKWETRVNQD